MRAKIMVLLLLSIFTFLLAGKKADNNLKNTEWKRIKSRKEVITSSRWIVTQNNVQIREIKAETYIHVPKDKLQEIIQSGIYTSEWMSMVENYYIKQGISQNQWESQLTLSLFWPLSKNNLEINYSLLDDCDNSTFITFRSKNASLLKKAIKPEAYQFKGNWELLPVNNNNSTKVILKIKWYKRNVLHHWFISPIISDGIFNSLKKLKHFSEEKYKAGRIILAAATAL